jgi:hypothetical protein
MEEVKEELKPELKPIGKELILIGQLENTDILNGLILQLVTTL